ncbi:MAG: PIG-L family deacetylase [Terriglobia bacterium]|jgi:LmbE family N-acetylglucosaminyl deacetylase
MRRRKFLASAGALGAIPVLANAKPPANPQDGTPERHSDLPAKYTPCAYSNTKTEYSPFTIPDYYMYANDLVIERNAPGKPHTGKVLAAIQAHVDDVLLFASGTVAKLIDEGYTGYLIRFSNDEASGRTLGHGVSQNEIDNENAAKAMGCKKAFTFYYRNHRMDDGAIIELRARLILLFRFLQVNTVFTLDPYNHYDENPDHLVVGKVVETANWMSSGGHDYPEHFKAGLKPARIREKYYYSRSPQGHNVVNRIVDISSYVDAKARVNTTTIAKGPSGTAGVRLREYLRARGKKLPWLGNDDETANVEYTKRYLLEDFHLLGQQYGLQYAEAFRYIGPDAPYLENIHRAAMQEAVDL